MSIQSEYSTLKSVIIHEPGYEWNLVTVESDMPKKYLIEDVLFAEHASADHREFSNCLRHVAGKEAVVEFTDLLETVLSVREVRSDVVGAVSALEDVGMKTHDLLLSDKFSPKELAHILIVGAYKASANEKEYTVLFPPIPNLMFTRDLGMFFGDVILLSHPAKSIRRREGLLAKYIFRNHKMFSNISFIDILDDATTHGIKEVTHLEGGDMLALDASTIVIGCSERTTDTAISLLTNRVLTENIVKRVIKVDMPSDRAMMHLDTVFTIIGEHDCVYYPPLFSEESENSPAPCTVYELVGGKVTEVFESSPNGLFTTLERFGFTFDTRIPCGGEISHYQTREQWTDGANLFAVSPEVAFIYERNIQTIAAFRNAGYTVLTPADFIKTDLTKLNKVLITLSGAELSRGRGGARCMTMPVSRNIG